VHTVRVQKAFFMTKARGSTLGLTAGEIAHG